MLFTLGGNGDYGLRFGDPLYASDMLLNKLTNHFGFGRKPVTLNDNFSKDVEFAGYKVYLLNFLVSE